MPQTIIFTLILYFASFCSFAGNVALPDNVRYIVVASRPTLGEAILLAKLYRSTFKYTDIFVSSNGWYSITIGTIEYPADEFRLDQYISEGKIPNDSYFSQGSKFHEVYDRTEIDQVLTTNSSEKQEAVVADKNILAEPEIVKSNTSSSTHQEQESGMSNDTKGLIAIGLIAAGAYVIFGGSSSDEADESYDNPIYNSAFSEKELAKNREQYKQFSDSKLPANQ